MVDSTRYRELVGSLLYLTHTRPNISYVVGAVSRYMQEPHEPHCKAAKRILRYFKGTHSFWLHYATDCTLYIVGYIDSDWAGDAFIPGRRLCS